MVVGDRRGRRQSVNGDGEGSGVREGGISGARSKDLVPIMRWLVG